MFGGNKMGFDQWDDEALVTAEEATHADGLKHAINSTLNTDCCAVLDRNDQNDEWRKVFLRRDAEDSWTLHDENGNLLDEPDSGCPGTGFTTRRASSTMSASSTTRSRRCRRRRGPKLAEVLRLTWSSSWT